MTRTLMIALLHLVLLPIHAQYIPNGGFEEWDSTYYSPNFPLATPLKWIDSVPNIPCSSPMNLNAQPSQESNSGNYSAMLTAFGCTSVGGARLEHGLIHSGNRFSFPPRDWAFECMARPTHLNFHYKFHPVEGDSAYVKIMLFHYDSITPGLALIHRIDTVGFASGYMHEETTSFTPFSLPIEYFTPDTPAFMHIFFSTSKTLSENPLGNTPPGMYAHVGTTLWLDDVHVSGGITSIGEEARLAEAPAIFPNPGLDRIWLKGPNVADVERVLIYDAKGGLVLNERITDHGRGIETGALHRGIHAIVFWMAGGRSFRTTWVKE